MRRLTLAVFACAVLVADAWAASCVVAAEPAEDPPHAATSTAAARVMAAAAKPGRRTARV